MNFKSDTCTSRLPCSFVMDGHICVCYNDSILIIETMQIWSVKTGELEGSSKENHNSWVTDIKFAANSQKLVSVGDNVKV